MKTDIYYFTGTGNSLYIARELQKLLPEAELIPVVKAYQSRDFITKGNNIGFVFPCHGLTVPIPVRNFLKKIDVSASEYFFAVVTRGGTIFRGFRIISNILKKHNKCLNSSFTVNMGSNDPKFSFYKVPGKKELEDLQSKALSRLRKIREIIINRENVHEDDNGILFSHNSLLNGLLSKLIPFLTHTVSPAVKKYFYANARCNGCGICAKVCPSGKIRMINNKPHWQNSVDCFLCYGCLNFCPAGAVQIYSKVWMKSHTTEKERYPHPYATIQDMVKQKGL